MSDTLSSTAAGTFWPGWLHAQTGPLTRALNRKTGGFGLGQVPAHRAPDALARSVCGYCSTGCSLNLHLRNGSAVGVSPTTEYPVNLGMACPKGWEALTVLDAPDRATAPLARDPEGRWRTLDWGGAARLFVERFQDIQQRHGREAVAFLGTGQLPTEELAFLGALAKFGMGMIHGDGNTRQCMATSVVAYKQAFGFDAPGYTYADLEESDCLVFIGANPCIAHPILWERVMRNRHTPQIIVVDPRMTETAMNATLHLPVAPKSDLTLLYGVARLLIERDWIKREFIDASTSGFSELTEFLQQFTLPRVSSETGLAREQIEQLAERIHAGRRVSFWWTMGVNQSYQGVRTAQAIINLALLTGNIGRPGTGANSITGQCNAMGSRLFSNTTNLLGGHDFANSDHRAKISRIVGVPDASIPTTSGWTYPEIMEGILSRKIRGLWVVGTNPAHSWINQTQAREILSRLDFLVVQDLYHSTETARAAHLLLPAAGWGEKDGTMINSERRIGVIRKVRRPPGDALADFQIFRLLARAWGCGELFAHWTTPAKVFELLKQCSAGQPCDFSGVEDYSMLERHGGVQWPLPEGVRDFDAERRLYEDGRFFHPDGRARFVFELPRPLSETPTEAFPLILLTGRGSVAQWHTQSRTAKSAVLRKLSPMEPFVEINPVDARRLGIAAGQLATIESQRGQMRAKAVVSSSVPVGQVFIPMHYDATNRLTDAVFDPYSKQPSYKACAVRVSK
ncbi:MAG: molybdopterin oxidoreductase family protein [Planctomycetales bacterium]